MTEDRLTGLALLYIHQDKETDKANILKRFDSIGHHRIKLSLVYSWAEINCLTRYSYKLYS